MNKYDEIEFFRKGKSLHKTCLQEGSDGKLRVAVAEHANIGWYDRFTIITNGEIRLDSDDNPAMKKEMDIFKYQIVSNPKKETDRYRKFWGKMFRNDTELYILDLETGEHFELHQVWRDDE